MFGGWVTYQDWREEQQARGTLEVSFSLLDRVLEVAGTLDMDVVSLSHAEYLAYRRNHMELWLPMPPLISLYSRACKWAYITELASAYSFAESEGDAQTS